MIGFRDIFVYTGVGVLGLAIVTSAPGFCMPGGLRDSKARVSVIKPVTFLQTGEDCQNINEDEGKINALEAEINTDYEEMENLQRKISKKEAERAELVNKKRKREVDCSGDEPTLKENPVEPAVDNGGDNPEPQPKRSRVAIPAVFNQQGGVLPGRYDRTGEISGYKDKKSGLGGEVKHDGTVRRPDGRYTGNALKEHERAGKVTTTLHGTKSGNEGAQKKMEAAEKMAGVKSIIPRMEETESKVAWQGSRPATPTPSAV